MRERVGRREAERRAERVARDLEVLDVVPVPDDAVGVDLGEADLERDRKRAVAHGAVSTAARKLPPAPNAFTSTAPRPGARRSASAASASWTAPIAGFSPSASLTAARGRKREHRRPSRERRLLGRVRRRNAVAREMDEADVARRRRRPPRARRPSRPRASSGRRSGAAARRARRARRPRRRARGRARRVRRAASSSSRRMRGRALAEDEAGPRRRPRRADALVGEVVVEIPLVGGAHDQRVRAAVREEHPRRRRAR